MRGYPQFAQALEVAWDPLAGADEIAGLPPCTMERGALSVPL